MTHKEKADELVERFYDPIEDFDLKNDYPEPKKRKECAIQCAIICVDEMVNVSLPACDSGVSVEEPYTTEFLQSVLNELKSSL